jgi:hypothetical protein
LPFPKETRDEVVTDARRRFVKIGGAYWLEATYIAALHTVGMERIQHVSDKASSPRRLLRSLRSMKTRETADATLREALKRVIRVEPGIALDEVKARKGAVVAEFPQDLTSPSP